MADEKPVDVQVTRTIRIETLSDVMEVINSIGEGLDNNSLTESKARIKQQNVKLTLKIADIIIANKRLERGKPERDLRLLAARNPTTCEKCHADVSGSKFCPQCGTAVKAA